MKKLTHWDYCQFLLVSQNNYTQTYFADHSEQFSHDRINRLMRENKLTPLGTAPTGAPRAGVV